MTLLAVITAVLLVVSVAWVVTTSRCFRPGWVFSNLPRGGGWSPPPRYPGAPGGGAGYPGGVVEGQVRGLATREERHGRAESFQTVWTFRVEKFDQAGKRVLFVPVEMRGRSFRGALAVGDWVRLAGTAKAGTVVTSEVTNLTTRARAIADDWRNHTRRMLMVIAAVVAGLIGVLVLLAIIGIIIYLNVTHR